MGLVYEAVPELCVLWSEVKSLGEQPRFRWPWGIEQALTDQAEGPVSNDLMWPVLSRASPRRQ